MASTTSFTVPPSRARIAFTVASSMLPVWVDRALTRDDKVVFNAGNHEQTRRMAYADFARLVQPRVASFSTQAEAA